MEEKQPLFSLDRESGVMLRGIAILFVLLGHIGYYVRGGAGGVVLFLVLSGYGLNLSCEKNGLDFFWSKRIRKVFLPYWIVGLFVLVGWRVTSPRMMLCTLLGLDFGQLADPTMWYISFLLLWYLLYYVLALLTRRIRDPRGRTALLLAGLFAASFGFRLLYDLGVWHAESGAALYTLAFPLGVGLSCLTKLKVRERVRTLFQLGFLFLTAAYMLGAYPHSGSELTLMIMGLQPIAVVLCVPIRGWLKSLLLWFGKYSYPIYLFEGLLLFGRDRIFSGMRYQPLIDLAFLAVTLAMALIYWEGAYKKLEAMLPWEKLRI